MLYQMQQYTENNIYLNKNYTYIYFILFTSLLHFFVKIAKQLEKVSNPNAE